MRSILSLFIIASFLSIFFQNCAGSGFDVKHSDEIVVNDPYFAAYVQEFEYYSGMKVNIPIAFDDLPKNQAGVCFYTFNQNGIIGNYIKIDRDYWPKMTPLQQKNLMFHEFGHCIMGRDHVAWNGVMMCPSSFMHDSVMSDYCLQINWESYMQELFGENR